MDLGVATSIVSRITISREKISDTIKISVIAVLVNPNVEMIQNVVEQNVDLVENTGENVVGGDMKAAERSIYKHITVLHESLVSDTAKV